MFRLDPFNSYQKDQGAYPGCPSVRTPNDSVEITFKVSGFDVDNPDAVEATPTPAITTTATTTIAATAPPLIEEELLLLEDEEDASAAGVGVILSNSALKST